MRASCSLMGVKARVGISAVLAPMAGVHPTTFGLSWFFGYPLIFAIGCELAADDWSAHVQCLWVEQPVRLADWVYCVDRFTHASAATVPDVLRCSHMYFGS